MGKGDQQRYIKITKIEIIFADAWQHLVMMTFHLRFPYLQPSQMFESEPGASPWSGNLKGALLIWALALLAKRKD